MIKETDYLKAQKIVDEYKKEQLNRRVVTSVYVRSDCPNEFWYSHQMGVKLNIKPCYQSDLRDVEGFGHKDGSDCWKVADGDFEGYVIDKKHCIEQVLDNSYSVQIL